MKTAALLLLTCAGCAAPHDLEVGYGHTWYEDGAIEGWPVETGDSDWLGVTLVWQLRPRTVVLESEPQLPPWPPLHWSVDPPEAPPEPPGATDMVADQEPAQPTMSAVEAVGLFSGLHLATQLALLAAVCWLSWIYRQQISSVLVFWRRGKK